MYDDEKEAEQEDEAGPVYPSSTSIGNTSERQDVTDETAPGRMIYPL
jgi:hypothetical protein